MSLPGEAPASSRWDRLLPWLGAALGFLWYLAIGGARTLAPTHLDWVGGGDFAQHVLGWLHFRNAPWGFPLGNTPTLMYPLTMTVGFTDSNPWVAVALKPFSRWLPQDFQYIGPWLALCFALQGWVGVKLVALYLHGALQRLLGATLFVMSPVLLFRTGHDTLCAHWLLLAMLWVHLRPRPDSRAAWKALGGALALNAIAAGVHPYLQVMVFALTVSLLFTVTRVEHHLSWRSAGVALAGMLATVGALFFLFGYVGQGISAGGSGFSYFSADMLTLVNPNGWSLLLPGFPTRTGQYEGFGYLGTGVIALIALLLLSNPAHWWQKAKAGLKPRKSLVFSVLALTLLAFSSVMTVAGETVLSLRSVTKPLLPLLDPFRSSGRFIWPLHYVLMTGVIALIAWRWRQYPRLLTGLLLGAVLLQGLDTPDAWDRSRFGGGEWPRLRAPEWDRLDPFYRHIVLYPPAIFGADAPCDTQTFPENAYLRFGYLAYLRGMTTNSVYPARLDRPRILAACQALRDELQQGRFAEDTLYVVGKKDLAVFQRPGITCGVLDEYTLCVAAKQGSFQEALSRATQVPTAQP
ncbi:DUF6311 domain-containing protein [Hyalangium rubrum]|uniref:DUF6311 domain-containing protein n=1 Tax=Hyalangium rubrum TaxID=3103134 RepID=A0ABU5HI76_9BACT|nr:DUF6311 domain-containing protein [Hyalangium sp. s54d21]MDY7233149.1 DUF6311 domain-containing protein [Hyalangium sp. s54d21]